jgi:hypothetical protein
MDTYLLLAILSLGLLAVVSGLCFVGCALDTKGHPPDFTNYQDVILLHPNCVAFWPLNEGSGTLAEDVRGKQLGSEHDGTYFDKSHPGAPGQYPCPSFTNSGFRSAACTGTLSLNKFGIVIGDFSGDAQSTAMETDGAYVEIAPNNVTTPANAFSVEAWISPGWDPSDSDAVHTFLDFRAVDATGAVSGFAMSVDGNGNVIGLIGRGTPDLLNPVGLPVTLGMAAYVVMTFDGKNATIFVNGIPNPSGLVSLNNGESYVPNTTGRQVIGAGAPSASNRTDQTASLFFPAFPFKGTIQDVAIYNAALSQEAILVHNANGNGENAD